MIPDPSTAEPFVEGGPASPAGEGSGTESPSPAGPSRRCCAYPDCAARAYRSHLCKPHYDAYTARPDKPGPTPILVACPDDLVPLAAQVAENDARLIFTLLWRAIGYWHLLEDSA